MASGRNWQAYDYRAITAGTLLGLIAVLGMFGATKTTFECDHQTNRCEITVIRKATIRDTRTVDMASVRSVKETCVARNNPAKPCSTYSLSLLVGERKELVFSELPRPVAEHHRNVIRNFLEDKSLPPLRMAVKGDITFSIGVMILALLMVALGIRKNMQMDESEKTLSPFDDEPSEQPEHASRTQ